MHELAQQHEHRHREQDQRAHAFVHAPHDDRQRRRRAGQQIGRRCQRERKRDWDAGDGRRPQQTDEEHEQRTLPHRRQIRLGEIEADRDQAHDRDDAEQVASLVVDDPKQAAREGDHEAERDGQRSHGPRPAQGRRLGEGLVLQVFIGRVQRQPQERERRADRERLGPALRARPDHRDEEGQPHVAAALHRQRAAQHGQPQEQDRGEFVGPDDRAIEHGTRDDSGQQNAHLGDDERRRQHLRAAPQPRSATNSGASASGASIPSSASSAMCAPAALTTAAPRWTPARPSSRRRTSRAIPCRSRPWTVRCGSPHGRRSRTSALCRPVGPSTMH